MNSMVRRWNKQAAAQQRPDAPDAIDIDGDRLKMAEPRKPDTVKPAPESTSALDGKAGRNHAMPRPNFRACIRWLNSTTVEDARQVRTATYTALKRVGVKRDLTKAVAGLPRGGSNQISTSTFVAWCAAVEKDDAKAVAQLLAFDATACKRT